jgi:uncharacterized membrane protein
MSNHGKNRSKLVSQNTHAVSIHAFRSSPLPPPAELEKYESLYPGATKLLFDNFVKQSDHRMKLETLVITEDNKRANKAQRNSFLLSLAILILSGGLFMLNKEAAGISAAITAIAPIIIAFITSSSNRKKELKNKRKSLDMQ